MNNYSYLLFSIGPVQEFLAAARKTLDLFSGSLLLSHLAGIAIEVILDNDGKMIFPFMSDKNDLILENVSSIPNRFFCKVPTISAKEIAKKAAVELNNRIIEIANSKKVKGSFGINGDRVWDDLWGFQISNFLEIYWVLLEDNENIRYAEKYKLIEGYLGKRKLLREFQQIEQPGIKCSLILNFSAVHPSYKESKKFWDEQVRNQRKYFKYGERLSSIAITKRKFLSALGKNDSFPSTSTISVSNFNRSLIKQAITDHDLKKSIGEYAAKVQMMLEVLKDQREIKNLASLYNFAGNDEILNKVLNIEGDWLFTESYNEKRIKKEYDIDDESMKIVTIAKESRDMLFNKIKIFNSTQSEENNIINSPSKYYAILYFDGDNMGKHLSEDNINEEEHKEISNALRKFSRDRILEIVEGNERLGLVIYSGGDDVLAFCGLDDLFDIILDIRNEFSKILDGKVKEKATGSIGVTIAHNQSNLQNVLESVRKTENYAKENLKRDAVAFALLKRSGDSSVCGAKWFPDEKNTVEFLKEFSKQISKKTISTSFIYDLENERIALEGNLHDPGLINSEIRRLLLKRTKPSQKNEIKKFFDEKLEPHLTSLKFQESNKSSTLKQFIDLLEVAQFIGRGGVR